MTNIHKARLMQLVEQYGYATVLLVLSQAIASDGKKYEEDMEAWLKSLLEDARSISADR